MDGGGIYVSSYREDTTSVSHCMVSGNRSERDGGGIYVSEGNLNHLTIIENTAEDDGGGIYIREGNILNSTISGNTSLDLGGGVFIYQRYNDNETALTNCVIAENHAQYGGGIHFYQYRCRTTPVDPDVKHCTISGNMADLAGGGAYWDACSEHPITNSILWGNQAPEGAEIYVPEGRLPPTVTFTTVQGGWPGNGNIRLNPEFVGGGDYHLTAFSPGIDMGTDAGVYEDMDGDIRPLGNGFDMGADEAVPELAPIRLPARDEYGYIPGVDMDHEDRLVYSFHGRAGQALVFYEAYDIGSPDEVRILINDQEAAYVPETPDDAWGPQQFTLLDETQLNDSSTNLLVFDNTSNPPGGHVWGVRSVFLATPLPSPVDVGYGRIPGVDKDHENEALFFFGGMTGDHVLSYEAYDIDGEQETRILINGHFIGPMSQTENDAWGDAQEVLLPGEHLNEEGFNILKFDNVRNPPSHVRWGVRNVTLLCTDQDGDGYGNPASTFCEHPEEDCDDSDPEVNPGMEEIPENGVDDDCNQETPGWGTPASVVGAGHPSSDMANAMLILLVPLGAVWLWKRAGRRKTMERTGDFVSLS